MKSFFRSALFLFFLFFLNGNHGIAESETHGNSGASPSQTTTGSRATQAAPLTDREMTFLSDNFFLSKLTVWNKYSEKLPQAIEKAIKNKDEKDSSQAIAELMGMVNKNQAEKVLENAKKEKDTENAKKPNAGDERYIALMERIVWGAKAFLKDPSKEESAEKYNKEFDEAFKTVVERNNNILEKIKQASEGNEQAKTWLRTNLDPSSLLSFVDGQKKHGNEKLADRIIDALSFKEGRNKFLDMSQQNETQRLHLGQTSESVSNAFDKFIENRKGFNGAVVSFSPFNTRPMKQWFVDNNGNFSTGAPSSFSTPSSISRSQTGNPIQSNTVNPPTSTNPTIASNSNNRNGAAAAYTTILTTCNKCHSGAVSIDANGNLSKDGSPRSKSDVLSAFTGVRQMAQTSVRLTATERASVMALISQWVK